MIILWPLYVLVFLKILNFLPTADRQKNACSFLIWWVNFSLDSHMGNILALCFVFQILVPLWTCTEINLRSPFIAMLFSIYSHPFLSALLSFLAPKCAVLLPLLGRLFPNEGAKFFSLQVLCSALNHDLPVCVSWGISVSNRCMWHLFSKLWFWEEDNASGKSSLNVPPSPWVPGVLWSTRSDSSGAGSWLCRLLFMAAAILHIYRERAVLMNISCL